MKIDPSEKILTGQWVLQNGQIVGDTVCDRIDELVESYLEEVGRDSSGWNILYRDPEDGRFWEMSYPQGDLQGGGPPELRCLSIEEIASKYTSTSRP